MAITRAQQVRQMLIKGGVVNPDGRRGFFEGAEKDAREKGTSISPGTDAGGNVRDDNPFTGGDGAKGPPQTIPKEKPKETDFQKFKRTFNPFPIATNLIDRISKSKLARINNAIQRQNYIDSLDLNNPKEKEEYDRIMNQLSGLGMDIIAGPKDLESTMLSAPPSMLAKDPMTQFKTVDGVSTLADEGVKDVLGQGYEDYLNRFETTEDRDGPQSLDPCKGPNPPAYCFIGQRADENQEAAVTRNLAGLTPRIGGGIFNFDNMADGGIAGMDREAFLLGGIAKGLKKAVKGVKKLVKSPIGKAAILGAVGFGIPGTQFGGIFGKGAASSFFGKGSFSPFKALIGEGTADMGFGPSGLGRLLGKVFVDQSTGSLTGLSKILIPSLAAGLMTKKQPKDEFDLASYYAQNQLEPSQSIRGMGSEFDFYGGEKMRAADGGLMRAGYQEGGDAEPVAKKTMPLLDMDGKEKDYRETGGFVDMGRMERADDVPARLSKNEFVFTADAVRNAGEGDIDKGAEVMYNMMKNLEAGGEVSEESQGLEGAREMFQTSQRLGEVI